MGNVAQTLRQTSDQLREQNKGAAVHEYIASATDQVERFSNYVRSANVSQMVNQVEQFARRQPGLFLGGAFVLGLLRARFLKSSGQASSAYSGPDAARREPRSAWQLPGDACPCAELRGRARVRNDGGEFAHAYRAYCARGGFVMPDGKEERSLGELFSELAGETATLVRKEVQLAKVELGQKAAQVGKEVAFIGLGGAVAYAGFLAVLAAVILLVG